MDSGKLFNRLLPRRRRKRGAHPKRRLTSERLESRALLAAIVWDGEAGDDNWHSAENWFDETSGQNDVLPTSADDVEIRQDFAGATVAIQNADVSINSLHSAAGIEIVGSRTLTLADTSQIDGHVELGGTINGAGTLTVTTSMNWTGGAMNESGNTVIGSDAVLTVDASTVSMNSDRTLENRGTINWLRGGLAGRTGAGIHNTAGALFDLQANVQLGGSAAPGNFLNEGTFRKSVGTGTALMLFPFENSGVVEVQSGTLRLYDGESTGDILVSDGTTLQQARFHTYTFDVPAGKRIGRAGAADQNVTFRVEGTATLQGAGEFDVDSITLGGGVLDLARDVTLPHVELDGTLNGPATLTITESMDWLRGGLGNNLTAVIASGAVLTADALGAGGLSMNSGATLENRGTVNWLRGGLGGTSAEQVLNMAGASFDIQANVTFSSAVLNEGVLRKSAGGGQTTLLDLQNTGAVEVHTGTLRLRNGSSTGDILLSDGTTLHQLSLGQFTFDVPAGRRFGRAGGGDENVTFLVEGSPTVQGAGDFDFDTIDVSFNSAHLTLARDVIVPHVELDGTMAGFGTLTVTESMDWIRGAMDESGKTVIADGAVLTVDTIHNVSLHNGRTLENRGTVNWVRGALVARTGSRIHNTPGALFEIQGGVVLGDTGEIFLNEGIFRKPAGGNTQLRFPFDNQGTVEVFEGTLNIQQGLANFDDSSGENRLAGGTWIISTADPTVDSAGIVIDDIGPIDVLNADVTLDGTGVAFNNDSAIPLLAGLNRIDPARRLTIAHDYDLALQPGSLENLGSLTIGPSSTLAVDGKYTQDAAATLNIGIGDDPATGLFGQLTATGDANLDGTFGIELFDGFGPTAGQSWDALKFANRNGRYAEFEGLYLGTTRAFDVAENFDNVVISAVADANDLAVDPVSVTVSGSGVVTEDVTVNYTVGNLTDRPAVGDWVDSVYLSRNATLDPFDVLLGRIPRRGGLAGMASYTEELTVPLPSALPGNYRVFVVADSRGLIPDQNRADNSTVSHGTIAVQFQQLPVGGSVSDSIAAGEFLAYQLDVPENASVRLTGTFETNGQATIYTRLGRLPSRSQFDTRSEQADNGGTNRIVSLPGTHYVLVYGDENSLNGRTFTLSAEAVVLAVSELQHNRGSNVGSATVTVTGTGFSPDSTVELLDAGGTAIASAEVTFNSSRRLFATFDLVGADAGEYDLRVTENESSALSPTAFTVTQDEAAEQLEVSVASPGRVLVGRSSTATITFENTGGADLPAEVLTVYSAGAFMRLKGGSDADFVRDQLQLLTVGDASTGVIAPGQLGTIEVEFQSITPINGNELFIIIDRPEDPDEPLNLTAFEDAFRPAHLPDDAWNAVFGNFTAQIGTTFGEYNDKVIENAAYLQSVGQTVFDVPLMNRMELLRADNALPGIPLGDVTDTVAPDAGLALPFQRVYRQAISNRFRLGSLGRGWMHNWETHLHEDEFGNLMLRDVTGSRFLQFVSDPDDPAGGGVYVSGAGLEEVLRQESQSNRFRYRRADGTVLVFRNDPELDKDVKPLLAIEEPNGDQISVVYSNDRISELQHSNGQALTLSYDANGRLSELLDHAGDTTTFEYDVSGEYLIRVTGPAGAMKYTYNTTSTGSRLHALTSIENLDGMHTFYDYNAFGQLTRIAGDGDAQPVSLSYPVGGAVVVTDANGNSESLRYDTRGRIAQVENAAGDITGYRYDEQMPPVVIFSHGVPQQHAANLNRILLPDGREVRMEYDSHGNVTQIRDAAGEVTIREYVFPPESDASSAVISETSSNGSTFLRVVRLPGTLTTPRPVNRLAGYTDELGVQTRYFYDEVQQDEQLFSIRGNLTRLQHVDGSEEAFSYDTDGNLTQSTNRRNQSIGYHYDDRGLLTQKTHPDGRIESFSYDDRGNLTTMTDTRGTTTLDYEAPDRLVRVTYPDGRSLSYTYDAAGNRTSISDSDGFTVNYTYDSVGRISQVLDRDDAMITGYVYDAVGRLSRQDNANDTFTTYDYNSAGRISRIAHHAPDATVRSFFDYTYDVAGRRVSTTTEDGTALYNYDANNRLTEVSLPTGRTIAYQYDAVGNRLSVTDEGTVTNYVINDLQQYTAVGAVTREFDADGNLIREVDGGIITTYSYDNENRLTGVSGPEGVFTYEYDALGNRIAQTHDSVRTEYMVDPTGLVNVAAEYDQTGNPVARYVYGQLGLIARFDSGGNSVFYEFDSPGSTTAVTDSAGNIANEYSYLPFGEVANSTETIDNPFTYVGSLGVMAEENGLHFMRARYYDSSSASFISLDPLRVPPVELYGYALDNPTQFVDPLGQNASGGNFSGLSFGPDDGVDFLQNSQLGAFLSSAAGFLATSATAIVNGAGSVLGGLASGFTGGLLTVALSSNEDTYNGVQGLVQQGKCGTSNVNAAKQLAALGFPGCGGTKTTEITSVDPNDIIGPDGVGEDNHIPSDATLPYLIRFENLDTATAPAHEVEIIHPLDGNLNLDTFELTSFGFGDLQFEIPADRDNYDTLIQLSDELFVRFEAELEEDLRQVVWTFTSIDPVTGDVPADPFSGFLPPNISSPQGEGFVSFTVQPYAGLPTSTRIDAIARIVFDNNDPIDTPAIYNTIDAGPPTSSVDPLPPQTRDTDLTVSWAGSDDAGGSGIASYDVYLSVDGGAFELLLEGTTDTSTTVPTEVGRSYAFYTVATDFVGNVEPTPVAADAVTTIVPNTPPVAEAGPNQSGQVSAVITLNGSLSSDADGDPLTYAWSFVSVPGGSTATLSDPTVVDPSFTADVEGTYALQLIVNDSFDDSPPDTVTIDVQSEVNNVLTVAGTTGPDRIQILLIDQDTRIRAILNGQTVAEMPIDQVDRIEADAGEDRDVIFVDHAIELPTVLVGGGGNDLIFGGGGPDSIVAGVGRDKVFGRGGNDRIDAGIDNDLVFGGPGDDEIDGSDGDDVVFGGGGNDSISGGQGADVLHGGGGANLILGGDDDDILYGGNDDDQLDGGLGNDLIFAAAGDDHVDGGPDDDRIYGGIGDDMINAGSGHDRVNAGLGDDVTDGGDGNDVLDGSLGDDLIRGNEGNDLIRGGFGDDELRGGTGDDLIYGNFGDDLLVGGPGLDTLVGGFGDDIEIDEDQPPAARATAGERISSADADDLQLLRNHDVNGDGRVSALDALIVINYMARSADARPMVEIETDLPFDINRDERISALDALLVVNRTRRFSADPAAGLLGKLNLSLDEESTAMVDEGQDHLNDVSDDLALMLAGANDDEIESESVDNALAELDSALSLFT